jgi:hypothetical protein
MVLFRTVAAPFLQDKLGDGRLWLRKVAAYASGLAGAPLVYSVASRLLEGVVGHGHDPQGDPRSLARARGYDHVRNPGSTELPCLKGFPEDFTWAGGPSLVCGGPGLARPRHAQTIRLRRSGLSYLPRCQPDAEGVDPLLPGRRATRDAPALGRGTVTFLGLMTKQRASMSVRRGSLLARRGQTGAKFVTRGNVRDFPV